MRGTQSNIMDSQTQSEKEKVGKFCDDPVNDTPVYVVDILDIRCDEYEVGYQWGEPGQSVADYPNNQEYSNSSNVAMVVYVNKLSKLEPNLSSLTPDKVKDMIGEKMQVYPMPEERIELLKNQP